ncbi:Glycerol-3-phosphate dehydrogenase [NAD(P)+] [Clostridiales bacterium CHKCI001]|nr:Glycerol-3-phosphate dehydrogenase [NAD(P)+] [Clostridiales bacterium CHKCI001]
MANVSVIGTGTWGTTLAILLHENGHHVVAWSAIPEEVKMLSEQRKHESLPGVHIPEGIQFTENLEEACKEKELIVMAVPSIFTRVTSKKIAGFIPAGQLIVNVAKGIEEDTLMTLSEQIEQEIPQANVAVLSGPSHAEEVSKGMPTTCVAGAKTMEMAETVQNFFMAPTFRVYTSLDVLGIELGGSLKNVIALAAGIADGLGCGDNAKAALITRGIVEIARLGCEMGGKFETFCGLSGIGDLIVTCASMHSRNRRAGILIGKGYTMQEAMDEVHMVVEGVYSAKAALKLGEKYHVTLPIIQEVNEVLFHNRSAREAVFDLMLRERTTESFSLHLNK